MIQPDYPSAMGLLAHLNSDELKEMLNDDTKFDTVLKDVKQLIMTPHTGSATSEQIETLLNFLDEHRDLARGRLRSVEGKLQAKRLWEELCSRLNSMGGCIKTVQQWQKVWFDRKHLAKKAASASRSMASATGGGPSTVSQLSHWELKVLEIMGDGFGERQTGASVPAFSEVKDWETEKEMIIASNRSLAEFNLSKEPELEQLKAEVQEKSASGEQLCSRIQELLEEYKTKSAGISPDTTHALLQTAAAETEEQSENIAQDFLSGKIDVDKFLEDFEPIRKKMHLRKFKAEKMGELLRSGNQSSYGNGFSKPYLPYPSYGPPQGVPSVPYPMGPLNMPMPGMYGNHF